MNMKFTGCGLQVIVIAFSVIYKDSDVRLCRMYFLFNSYSILLASMFEYFSHHDALDSFNSFFVNHFIDHHAHEFITTYVIDTLFVPNYCRVLFGAGVDDSQPAQDFDVHQTFLLWHKEDESRPMLEYTIRTLI